MARSANSVHSIRNQRGFLSVDFLFAMTMAAVLCMIMFALTTTLSMIEIAQYVAFATARAHAAAHLDQDKQITQAQQKFESYIDDKRFPALAPLFQNGWFSIIPKSLDVRGGGHPTSGSSEASFNDSYGFQQNAMPQTGVRFRFQAKILKMNLPLLGSISDDDDFGTYVTGMLLREPTSKECKAQFEPGARFRTMLDQDGRFRGLYQGGVPKAQQNAYFGLEDNGC